MSSSKSCFELLKSHDIQTIPTNRGRVLRVFYTHSQFRKLSAKIKISSKIYEIEKGKMSLFFICSLFYKMMMWSLYPLQWKRKLASLNKANLHWGGRKGLRWCGFVLFLVRFCGNFYFNSRYCGFKTLSGLRLLQHLSRGFRWKKSVCGDNTL